MVFQTKYDIIPIKIPIIENVINLFGLIFVLFFMYTLVRTKKFHINIRILMMSLMIYFLAVIISRFLIFIALLEGKLLLSTNFVVTTIHKISVQCIGSIFPIFVTERIIASIRYKTYETENSKIFSIFVCLIQFLFITIYVYFSLYKDPLLYILKSTNFGTYNYCIIVTTIHKICVQCAGTTFVIFVIERIIASIRYKTYETENYKWFTISACLLQFTLFSIYFYLAIFKDPRYYYNEHTIPCLATFHRLYLIQSVYYVTISATIISSILFVLLIFINNRLYQNSSSRFSKDILSIKFQIIENLQLTKAFFPCIMVYVCSSIIEGIILIVVFSRIAPTFTTLEDIHHVLELAQLTDIPLTISFVLIPLITNLKLNSFTKLSFKKRNKTGVINNFNHTNSHSLTKKKSNNRKVKSENDVYFEQFHKQWK
uniref:G_PROTEIN_RECEP_F1_2 domain-containing protein n=1 Tax=Parastrongyloides trichosuri TaxID=131310 RepID=A0A0N4ZQB8_PARTI